MIRCIHAIALIWLSAAPLAFADGGALLLHQQNGTLIVSVFATPSPLHAGSADFSVLLQEAATGTVLLDGTIDLELSQTGQDVIKVNATPGQATNKLLYAATLQIPQPGEWSLTAHCRVHGNDLIVPGKITVLGPEPAILSYWLYFAIVPIAIALFTLNQRLKIKRRSARLPKRP